MSNLISNVTAGNPLSGVKRNTPGNPTHVPGALPGNRGVNVAPGGPVKVPKLNGGNKPNQLTNVAIPVNRVVPLEFLSGWVGRASPGDCIFLSKYPPGYMRSMVRTNHSGMSTFNATNGVNSVARIIGVDGLNRLLHGESQVSGGWIEGHNVLFVGGAAACAADVCLPSPEGMTAASAIGLVMVNGNHRFRLRTLDEYVLDGVCKSNDEQYSFLTNGSRDATILNIIVQGPTMVNNGFLEYDDIPNNTLHPTANDYNRGVRNADTMRTVETYPRGSMEGAYHISAQAPRGAQGKVGSQAWMMEGMNDFVASFSGQYTTFPTQSFDRRPNILDTIYLGLRAYELNAAHLLKCKTAEDAPSVSDVALRGKLEAVLEVRGAKASGLTAAQKKTILDNASARKAAAEANEGAEYCDRPFDYYIFRELGFDSDNWPVAYFYQYVPMSGRKAHQAQVLFDYKSAVAYEKAFPASVVAGMERLKALKVAQSAGVRPSTGSADGERKDYGIGSATMKNYPFDEDPFDAVRTADLKMMVGAWNVGRILDTRACKYNTYDGGPVDGASGMRVDVQVKWIPARAVQGGSANAAAGMDNRLRVNYHQQTDQHIEGTTDVQQARYQRAVDLANAINPSMQRKVAGTKPNGDEKRSVFALCATKNRAGNPVLAPPALPGNGQQAPGGGGGGGGGLLGGLFGGGGGGAPAPAPAPGPAAAPATAPATAPAPNPLAPLQGLAEALDGAGQAAAERWTTALSNAEKQGERALKKAEAVKQGAADALEAGAKKVMDWATGFGFRVNKEEVKKGLQVSGEDYNDALLKEDPKIKQLEARAAAAGKAHDKAETNALEAQTNRRAIRRALRAAAAEEVNAQRAAENQRRAEEARLEKEKKEAALAEIAEFDKEEELARQALEDARLANLKKKAEEEEKEAAAKAEEARQLAADSNADEAQQKAVVKDAVSAIMASVKTAMLQTALAQAEEDEKQARRELRSSNLAYILDTDDENTYYPQGALREIDAARIEKGWSALEKLLVSAKYLTPEGADLAALDYNGVAFATNRGNVNIERMLLESDKFAPLTPFTETRTFDKTKVGRVGISNYNQAEVTAKMKKDGGQDAAARAAFYSDEGNRNALWKELIDYKKMKLTSFSVSALKYVLDQTLLYGSMGFFAQEADTTTEFLKAIDIDPEKKEVKEMRDKGTLAKNIEKFCEKLREAYLRMNSSDEASLRLSGDDVITKREFVYFMMYPETAVDGSKTVPSTLAEFQKKIDAMSWANDFFMAKSAFNKLAGRVGAENVLEAGADDLYKGLTELRAIFHPADVRPTRTPAQLAAQARSAPVVAEAMATRASAGSGKAPAKAAPAKPPAAATSGSTATPAPRRREKPQQSVVASVFDAIGLGASDDLMDVDTPASPTPSAGSGSDASGPRTFSKRPR